jgi:hypothetical protein
MVMVKMVKMGFGLCHFAHYKINIYIYFIVGDLTYLKSDFDQNDHDHDRIVKKS